MPNDIFLQLCQQETAVLSDLLVLLEAEQRAIVRFDAMKLDCLTVSKQQALLRLQELKSQRLLLLAEHHLDSKSAFLPWLSVSVAPVQAGWLALEHALAKVQALNDINASMAAERMSFATDALAVLHEEAQAIDGYRRDGNFASAIGVSRRLGSA